MNRIINVNVGGNHISKDKKTAGVRGESNVEILRITFDESWDDLAKTVIFLNAYGENPVEIVLGTNLLESTTNTRVYLVPIPFAPLQYAGTMSFIIEGSVHDGKQIKRQKSFTETLEVKDSPHIGVTTEPVDPEPSVLEQMQAEIESIKEDICDAVEAKEAIENMSVSIEKLSSGANPSVNKTENDGVVNLHFGIPAGFKGDRGPTGVYIGDEEPTDPDVCVWIDTDGEETDVSGKSAYQLAVENGFEGTVEEWLASLRGDDYILTADDSEEIADAVMDEIVVVEKSATLSASGWQGSSAPYLQTVTVDGITTDTNGTVSVSESATDEQYRAATYAMLRKTAQGANSVTIKAYGEKPTVDIPLTVRIGG